MMFSGTRISDDFNLMVLCADQKEGGMAWPCQQAEAALTDNLREKAAAIPMGRFGGNSLAWENRRCWHGARILVIPPPFRPSWYSYRRNSASFPPLRLTAGRTSTVFILFSLF